MPSCQVLPDTISDQFLEYMSLRSTLAPPHPSPLASQLMSVDGVKSVFYGPDFITITKAADADWAHLNPEIFSLITASVNSGESIVNVLKSTSREAEGINDRRDSLQILESDDEIVGMIKELLETRIRPAIQEDGGDIEYRGFKNGKVYLKLRGACRTCDSSTITLKNGIENMLAHYVRRHAPWNSRANVCTQIEEVTGIEQVLDDEEEIAIKEFAKFEEKLMQRKGLDE